ncbi:hypothetical protein ACIBED_00565 [Rhodococcus coprophilus]|uniref:hypothetical protein n=1 Tax=Rhodococcus coprophilus TaxID=38310 RepID=UPI0037975A61
MRPKGSDLDLGIGWENFEKLMLAVSRNLLALEGIELRRYGTAGQEQHGIDIAGREPDGRYSVVQCKDYRSLTPAKLKRAIEKFIKARAELPFTPYRFVVATSFPGDPTQLYDELVTQQEKYSDLELQLWGSEKINEALRMRADIVARFWTTETAENFCIAPIPGVPVPDPDRASQADQVLVGPLASEDIARRMQMANSESINPLVAAEIFESVAVELEGQGFREYAFAVRDNQLDALVEAESLEEAAALAARLAAVNLYHNDGFSAERMSRRLDKLVGEDIVSKVAGAPPIGSPVAVRHAQSIRAAVDVTQDLFGDTEELISVLRNPPAKIPSPDYQPLLVLFLAESMLVDEPGKLSTVDDLIGAALKQIAGQPLVGVPNDVAIRLRLIRSDYDDNERKSLVRAANAYSIPKRHAAWVKAREARRRALAADKSDAQDYWRAAINDGIHDHLVEDAADWLFAIRRLRVAYGPPSFGPDEEFRRAQALRGTSGTRLSLLPRYRNAREHALTELVAGRARSAIVATRRWLVDSIVTGHWADEAQALELLGDLYAENSEPKRASICYQRSDRSKKLSDLMKDIGDDQLPVGPLNDGNAPWWELRARAQILTEQSDLLDDETAMNRLRELTDLAKRGRSGGLTEGPDRALALEATKGACALAARGTAAQAREVLDMLTLDVPRKRNQYRHTDPAHAKACAMIAATHPDLAYDALERLFDLADNDTYDALVELNTFDVLVLLGAEQYDRPIGAPKRDSPLTLTQRTELRNRVRRLVLAGRYRSADLLQQLEPDSEDLRSAAQIGRDRILTRPAADSNSANSGIGLVSDAALVRALHADDQKTCLDKLFEIAHDGKETAENRREALIGASLLVRNQTVEVRAAVFNSCQDFVSGDKDGSAFDELSDTPHPLSAFKVYLGSSSLRSAGLTLALASANDNDQYTWILNEAFVLLRSTEDSDLTRAAHIINQLPREVTDRLPPFVISGISGSANVQVRQLSAVLSIRAAEQHEALALQLALDSHPGVRRTLAGALSVAKASEAIDRIKDVVKNDVRYSVRRRLADPTE